MNYQFIKRVVLTAAVATASTCLMNTGAVAGMFLKIPGVTGDTTDKAHKGQIDIGSFQWGMGRGISSGGEASCPSISEVTITKQLDSATPKIIGDFIMGQVYEEVVVSWNLSSGAGDYLKVTMGEAQLSGYSTSSGGDRPSENLSIHFATMKGEYRTIEKDGKLSSTSIKWDLNDKTCR